MCSNLQEDRVLEKLESSGPVDCKIVDKMRELKQETAKTTVVHLSPPIYSKEPEIFSDGSEKSYSSSNASEANAPIIIIVMFSFVVSIPLLVLALRCFLCGEGETDQNRISQAQRDTEQGKLGIGRPVSLFLLAPTFKYSAKLDLAGSERECIICLSEFVDGEEVKVLTRCKHGFHVRCIDQWFSSHLSCPLCRSRVRFSSMVEREEDYGNRASNSQAAFVRPENETVDSSAA